MVEVYTYLAPLPDGVNEAVTPCADGCFTIYINDKLTWEQRLLAYGHALHHIEAGDFDRADVQEIETRAHREIGAKEGH